MITKDNACWPTVESAIEQRLAAIHRSLESARIDDVQRLQGEATALRWLLDQAELPPAPKLTPLD